MTKNNNFRKSNQLQNNARKVHQKISNALLKKGWIPVIEFDPKRGFVILAYKNIKDFGSVIRVIRPYPINSIADFSKAVRLQGKERKQLVEVAPYRVFLGNKIVIPDFDDFFNYLTIKDLSNWSKFFRRSLYAK